MEHNQEVYLKQTRLTIKAKQTINKVKRTALPHLLDFSTGPPLVVT
jgi:hypothetical protein